MNYIREKDLENFLGEIQKKEIKNKGESNDLYMEKISKKLFGFEKFFFDKNGRNIRKKQNN